MPDFASLIPPLCALTRTAGRAVLGVYEGAFEVKHKDDASPLTEADLQSERIILEGLRRLTPDIPIVSEEATAAGVQVDVSRGCFWLVDPLDGTKEFVKRNGEFTINIGLIWEGVATVGLLYLPVGDRLFHARPGQACLEENGGPARTIACREIPAAGLTVLSSRSHRDPAKFDAFVANFPVATTMFAGSALKFALIAAGEADLYPRFGPTMEWDVAAGHAILNAAGGCLTLPDGKPLIYGKPGFLNPSIVAWSAAARKIQKEDTRNYSLLF